MQNLKLKFNFQQHISQFKTPILYSVGSIAKAFASMVVGFVVARYVSPNDYGVWTTINLAVTYTLFLQAGLINGLNLELPFTYGKGDNKQARLLAGTVQTFTIISSALVLFIGVTYFLFFPEKNLKINYGVLAITFVIILSFYQNYLMSTFRSNNSFLKLSYIQFVDAFVNILTLVFVVYYAYYGLLIKSVFVLCIYVLLLHLSRPIKVGLIWNKVAFFKLLKVGIPIFGLAYIESISSTADKLWILKFSDFNNVGLYSFSFSAFSMFSLFSASVASYIYPKMTYNYGINNDKKILWHFAKKITIILFITQIPLAIIGSALIPILVTTYFPKYILSIYAMQILVFAGVFKGSVAGVNVLWSIKSWKHMIIYQLSYSVLLVIMPYIGIQLYADKIVGVAYGVLTANILNLISGITLTYYGTNKA